MMVKLILACLSVLTIAISVAFFATNVVASPYGAGTYNAAVPYGGQTQLSISTSGAVALAVSPSDSGASAVSSGTVTVTSSDVVGYKLYIRALSSAQMTNGAATIAASANGSPAPLSINTWGYNTNGSSDFVGVTLTDVLIRSATQPYTAGDVTTVTYGVNVNNAIKAGNYTASVLYTAVPQTD